MERKIAAKLLEWKKAPDRKPLLLCGARQVGKTHSALSFGRESYANVAYFNFEFSDRLHRVFDGDLDPHRIVRSLSALSGSDIVEEGTLIVFDEVQACPRALTSLKYFRENAPGYHLMATGSMLGASVSRDGASFPVGSANMLRMGPMDLEEFMAATGRKGLAGEIRRAYRACEEFDLHDAAMGAYREYLAVGGLPEAVNAYREGRGAGGVAAAHADLDAAYVGDMSKYTSKAEALRIRAIWSSIPRHLAREDRRFVLRDAAEGARTRDMEGPLEWIRASGLASMCPRVSSGRAPLAARGEDRFFKLYMFDTGLLASKLGAPFNAVLSDEGAMDQYRGPLAENFVMQSLKANGVRPSYWSPSPNREVDFVFQGSDGAVIPVEVKASARVGSRSLSAFMGEYGPRVAARVSAKNFGFEGGILSVPLYAAFCLDGSACEFADRSPLHPPGREERDLLRG
ncbi:MAG: ATP-binding protein [Candidatus Methanoplasma sp.]|jgi:predicted AAA+ superfamily ATPase|nr:ATP-binding protein [Candidatus Methanoplasma sp.]